MAWDEAGRMFVTEIHGYNLEGHLDVTELNKTGKLDTAVRRVRVGPQRKAEARRGQTGSLKLLRDTDDDGRMDEAVLWADDIEAAYGVVAARGGVIVTAEPDIWYFADTDGDDRPDVRELLFTGFERGEMERAINNPVWGPDNWIYAGRGWGGAKVTGPRLAEPVTMGRTDFRFKPDGSAIEPVSGENHTFGMCFDDFGNRFLITTGQPVRYAAPLPYRYLARNRHVPSPETTTGATPYHETFPASEPHPWRRKRGADPRWVEFYGAGEAKPNGNLLESESDPNVLLQLALSLGESASPEAVRALARLGVAHRGIRWMESAVLSSIGESAGAFLRVLLAEYRDAPGRLVERAAETAVRSGAREAVAEVMSALAAHPDEVLRMRLLAFGAEHGLDRTPELREAANDAMTLAGDRKAPPEKRLAASRLAGFAGEEGVRAALSAVTDPAGDPGFQEQALRELLASPKQHVAAVAIELIPALTPRAVAIVTEGLLSDVGTARQLLEAEVLTAGSFSALQRHRLLRHDDETVKELAEALFASADPREWDPTHAAHLAALKSDADAARGAQLYATHCAACHIFAGKGFAVGPPLDGEAGRPAESLLADILAPSQNLTAGYATYLVKTAEGGSHAGVLTAEAATSLTLTGAGGAASTVLRSDIASIEQLDLSLMPATFAEALGPQDAADLIAYLKSRPVPGAVTLFDDDPAFPGLLGDGQGTARLDWRDAASGRACLTIEGFQRHARQLPGWKFAIRERPQPGEFRYLRLAMKTRGSKGMMLELAADGVFPPEDEAVRTYYAGANSTGWKSNELSSTIPGEWQTFTIDLWKGNGDFKLTGLAFTVMNGEASYDRIELLREEP